MRFLLLNATPLAALALFGCHDTYSQDPKVATAYAAAAGGVAVAQAVAAAHSSDYAPASYATSPSGELHSARDYALRAVNRIREDHALPPLTPSDSLHEFAQRGSEWLEEDHQPHDHLASDARCAKCGENQGSSVGEPAAPVEVQIDGALRAMMADDPQARGNLLSASWRFVGVGVVGAGGAMYLTIDFADGVF
jgi:uncharacterized protein YkwD